MIVFQLSFNLINLKADVDSKKSKKDGILLENQQTFNGKNSSSIIDKINFLDKSILIKNVNYGNDQDLLGFLNRENLSSYDSIIFENSDISNDLIDILVSTCERFPGIVLEFQNCQMADGINSIEPENFTIILNKIKYLGPKNLSFNIPVEIANCISFAKKNITINSLDFTNQKNIDALTFLINQSIEIESFIIKGDIKKTKFDAKLFKFLDTLNEKQKNFKVFDASAFALNLPLDSFKSPDRNFFVIFGLNIFFKDKLLKIPSMLEKSIEFNQQVLLLLILQKLHYLTKITKIY